MKNNSGYARTNPYNGTAMGSTTRAGSTNISTSDDTKKANFHKDACCGFHNNGDQTPASSNFCHTSYCNVNGQVTSSCRTRLAEICDDEQTFANNKHCTIPYYAYLNNNAWMNAEDIDSTVRPAAQSYSKSLTEGDYRNIGKKICKKKNGRSPFEPADEDESDYEQKNRLRESCIKWCSVNPDECKDEIVDFCKGVYDESVDDNNGKATPRFLASQNVCGCNWPDSFYVGMRDTFIKDWNVPSNSVSNQRHCVNASCATSRIGDTKRSGLGGIYSPGGAGGDDCPDNNIINCIQEVSMDVDGDVIVTDGGNFTFQPEIGGNCTINMSHVDYTAMANYYNNVSSSETTTTTGNLSEQQKKLQKLYLLDEEGNISIYSILLIICCCCCCFFFIAIIMFSDDDDYGDGDGDGGVVSKKCSDGSLNCKLESELDS